MIAAPWPEYDPALAAEDEVTLPIQINGKRRDAEQMPRGLSNEEIRTRALANSAVQAYLSANNLVVKDVIVVPDRIVNIVAG